MRKLIINKKRLFNLIQYVRTQKYGVSFFFVKRIVYNASVFTEDFKIELILILYFSILFCVKS